MDNKRSYFVRNTYNRRKRKSLATVGIIVVVLALVGIITVIALSVRATNGLLDKSKDKQKLEHFILPVIMFDPLTFDSPQNADPLMLLRSSLWSTILSKDRNQFTQDDYGQIIIPKSDVDVQAAKLYGPDIKLQHQTFGNEYELYYQFDDEQQVYIVPVSSQMAVYTPKILGTSRKGDIYSLEVGYIPPGNLWQTDAEGNTYEPEPDKVMLLDLKKVKDGYNIVALRDGPDTFNQGSSAAEQVTPEPSSMPEDLEAMASVSPDDESSAAGSGSEDSAAEPDSEADDPSSAPEEPANPANANTPPKFARVSASTTAPEGLYHSYEADNVTDGDLETAWTAAEEEGKSGTGWLQFEADEAQLIKGLRMTNGFTRADLYLRNNQITKVRLEFSDGTSEVHDLSAFPADAMGEITLKKAVATKSVKIVIETVKPGSDYTDTCITEVEFF